MHDVGVEISSGKTEVRLAARWVNIPGTLGFSDEARANIDLGRLGAIVTNPVSLNPRQPARPTQLLPFAGGFLLHTGHPNPGLRQVLRRHTPRWASLSTPVLLTILAQDHGQLEHMLRQIEPVAEIAGLVLAIEPTDPAAVAGWIRAAAGAERPVVALLPLGTSAEAARAAAEAGASAIILGPPRGAMAAAGQVVHGRLHGPALFPLALHAAETLSAALPVPLIVSGGIERQEQALACLQAGAAAVGLDYVLWKNAASFFSPAAAEASRP